MSRCTAIKIGSFAPLHSWARCTNTRSVLKNVRTSWPLAVERKSGAPTKSKQHLPHSATTRRARLWLCHVRSRRRVHGYSRSSLSCTPSLLFSNSTLSGSGSILVDNEAGCVRYTWATGLTQREQCLKCSVVWAICSIAVSARL